MAANEARARRAVALALFNLTVASSRSVKLGATVATVGFPSIGLQGFAPKLAKGEIASLSGAGDDARYFQISVPVQPGNSRERMKVEGRRMKGNSTAHRFPSFILHPSSFILARASSSASSNPSPKCPRNSRSRRRRGRSSRTW